MFAIPSLEGVSSQKDHILILDRQPLRWQWQESSCNEKLKQTRGIYAHFFIFCVFLINYVVFQGFDMTETHCNALKWLWSHEIDSLNFRFWFHGRTYIWRTSLQKVHNHIRSFPHKLQLQMHSLSSLPLLAFIGLLGIFGLVGPLGLLCLHFGSRKRIKKRKRKQKMKELPSLKGGAGGTAEMIQKAIRSGWRHGVDLKPGRKNPAVGNCSFEVKVSYSFLFWCLYVYLAGNNFQYRR